MRWFESSRPSFSLRVKRPPEVTEWPHAGANARSNGFSRQPQYRSDDRARRHRPTLSLEREPGRRDVAGAARGADGSRRTRGPWARRRSDAAGVPRLGAHRRAAERKGSFRIVAPEGQILRLLRITGLLDVLRVYPSIETALNDEGRLSGLQAK